jgi:15-cis-phytoene synthase
LTLGVHSLRSKDLREFPPHHQIALAYAPARLRQDFKTLLGLDQALGNALRATREAALSQIRLAWWRDQLDRCDGVDPLLIALKTLMSRYDVKPADLAKLADGWEIIVGDQSLSDQQLSAYGAQRGGGMFSIAGQIAGYQDAVHLTRIGAGWALADFALQCSDAKLAQRALDLAAASLDHQLIKAMSKPLRTFALLARFAEDDCAHGLNNRIAPGSPQRMIQAIGFALFQR